MNKYVIAFAVIIVFATCLLTGCSDDPVQPEPVAPTIQTFSTNSSDYISNRFFKLDLPSKEMNGRAPDGEFIDVSSIKIFKLMGPGQFGPYDVINIAAYVDRTGFRDWNPLALDFAQPHDFGYRWRLITDFDFMQDRNGQFEGIDLKVPAFDYDILAVVYDVVDSQGVLLARVGDDPSLVSPTQTLPGTEGLYYRMKLLKTSLPVTDPHVFDYVMRNVYSLQNINIDTTAIHDLRIEARSLMMQNPEFDESMIPYVRIFGLDSENPAHEPVADGVVDFHNPMIFDFQQGLLRFPADMPEPFNASEAQYAANANHPEFSFANSHYLADFLAPELYRPGFYPHEYDLIAFFEIVFEIEVPNSK